jgi:hypothetical protein
MMKVYLELALKVLLELCDDGDSLIVGTHCSCVMMVLLISLTLLVVFVCCAK